MTDRFSPHMWGRRARALLVVLVLLLRTAHEAHAAKKCARPSY